MVSQIEVIVIGIIAGALLGAMVGRWLMRRRNKDHAPTRQPVGTILLGALLGAAAGVGAAALLGEGLQAIDDLPALTTLKSFETTVLDSDTPVLIFVHTSRCPACVQAAPTYRQLATDHADEAIFMTLNADTADPALVEFLNLRAKPVPQMLLFYKAQRFAPPAVGLNAVSEDQVREMLSRIRRPATADEPAAID